MIDTVKIWLSGAEKTVSAGRSLAQSLYAIPLTIRLCGGIGAGKTTFLQGFADGLGIRARVQSPTFALEQRYRTPRCGELLHIDCHRLSLTDAQGVLEHTASHPGIRCIEWPQRAGMWQPTGPFIDISFDDGDRQCRWLTIHFHDVPLPDRLHVQQWRKDVRLPRHVCRHCDAVGAYAEFLARELLKRGIIVRPLLLRRSGELHDLLRFLDFRDGLGPPQASYNARDRRVWGELRARYPSLAHELACAAFLETAEYHAVGRVVRTHGARLPPPHEGTIEQKVLFYADKRLKVETLVTLEERFRDLHERYGEEAKSLVWYVQAQDIERELFPGGTPPLPARKRWRRPVGMVLLVLGLLAFFTPLTPGSWLALVGLELLGVRLTFFRRWKKWRPWKR